MMAINSLNWEKKHAVCCISFFLVKFCFQKPFKQHLFKLIRSRPPFISERPSSLSALLLVSLHLTQCWSTSCPCIWRLLCRKPWNIAVLLRPRPLFSGSVASCTRWQLPYSMFSNFLSMFSCFCAYKLSWLYPLAETVDLHVPKYRKHRWHARSMSEAVFYFAFSAQTCLHCMKTRFFQLFTIEIFWYLFQTSFFARIPHELYLNPFQ